MAPPADDDTAALDETGGVVVASWTCGIAETVAWLEDPVVRDARLFVDAPLVVDDATGQRLCEKQTGQLYSAWKLLPNTSNLGSRFFGGVCCAASLRRAAGATTGRA
jgi:predicted RNase H-like nuclease